MEMSFYTFNIKSFGWYNIDKLKRLKNPVNLTVLTDEELDVFITLLRENICLRALKKSSGGYFFIGIPNRKNVRIIAYRQNDKETINIVNRPILTADGKVELKPSKKTILEEFRRMIKKVK